MTKKKLITKKKIMNVSQGENVNNIITPFKQVNLKASLK